MNDHRLWQRALVLAVTLALVATGGLLAQATGNVFVTVTDQDGSPLPGVTVTLSGIGADRTQITDAQGDVRFLGLDPGQYTVNAELEGFGSVNFPGVAVNIGRNTAVPLVLQAAVEETITVTSESPLLDERRLAQGTTVSQVELEKIPTARDPWALLSQTPGVSVDRVNVGGSESGQQAVFRAQGVDSDENDFQIDGVQITDMRAIGASTSYFDFDQFAEMSFTTGGTDVTKNSAGVQVNLVTKRGSNEFRGSARFFNTKADGYFGGALDQSDIDVGSDLHPRQCLGQGCAGSRYVGASINEIADLGFEAGGAVVRDRLWAWGSWGQNDIKQFAASGDPDDTVLENTSVKLNAQIVQANSAVASWNNGDKVKNGRGAGPDRAPETLWDQRGPSAVYRVEDTHVFSSNFFLTGTWSHVDGGFQLVARGPSNLAWNDPAAPDPLYDSNGVWQNNFLTGYASNPSDELKLDSSYFFSTGNLSHELKVGGRYREFESFSDFAWGPREVFQTFWGTTVATRGVAGPVTMEYFSLWAQDTITWGRATINAGLRFDDQEGTNEPNTVPAHPLFPNAMPSVSNPSAYSSFSWDSILPRIGVTYALGQDRDTLLRGSFAQFADQLSVGFSTWDNVAGVEAYGYFAGGTEAGLYAAYYFDPLFPQRSPQFVDPGFDAPITSELLLSVEHSLLPELVIGGTFTWRNVDDIPDTGRDMLRTNTTGGLRPAVGSDYAGPTSFSGNLPTNFGGGAYENGQYWQLACTDPFDNTPGCASGGFFLTNGVREREYQGFAVNFTKRLANRWMARGFVSWGEDEWDVPAEWFLYNNPTRFRGGGQRDGDIYMERATGSGKGERFLSSTWTANLNGLYQIAPDRPWGFNVSGSVNAREGHPVPFYDNIGGVGNIQVVDDGARFRMDDVITVDFRIEKEFALAAPVNLTFGIDVFNAFNEQTPLSFQTRTDVGSAGNLQDNVQPRIYRLGVRLGWR